MARMTGNPLFSPFNIRSLTLSNRIVMAPMTRRFSPGGVPGPDVAAYYARRAHHGVGLIVTEGALIDDEAAGNLDNVPHFYGDAALEGWRAVADAVHQAGGRIFPQLWHVGVVRAALQTPETPNLLVRSPSGVTATGEKVGEPLSET